MSALTTLLRPLAVGLGLAGLVTACVRLNEPDHYVCDTDADCESDETCPYSGGWCVNKDFCVGSYDCAAGERCAQQRCVAAQCTPFNEATACNGYECRDGACETSCSFPGNCADGFHCAQSVCIPGAVLANGRACKTDGECSSNNCCAKPSGSVCANSCPATPTDACSVALDCVSGNCCLGVSGEYNCSAVPCPEVPQCASDDDCSFELVCENQQCVDPPPLKPPGEACTDNAACKSDSCVKGVCRGSALSGDDCSVDVDCAAGRICCKSPSTLGDDTCSEVNRGCHGSIGATCDSHTDCIDKNCNGSWCTKACTTNTDCGVSPWGVPNACETNGLEQKVCFPGCTTSQQCYDNVDETLWCYVAFDSDARICAEE